MRKWLSKLAFLPEPEDIEWREERECGIRAYPWEIWMDSKKPKDLCHDDRGKVIYDDQGRVIEDPDNIIGDKRKDKKERSKSKSSKESKQSNKSDNKSVND